MALWILLFLCLGLQAQETQLVTSFEDDEQMRLLSRIIDLSGAAVLPDPDGARGRPFRTFSSLDEYQRTVLGASATGDREPGEGEG